MNRVGTTCAVFHRALGFVGLWVFGSLAAQLDGLVGPNGIRPAVDFIARVVEHFEARSESAFLALPTLTLFVGADPLALHGLCAAGLFASVFLLAGRPKLPCLMVMWVTYLSLTQVGAEFFRYQWDALFLETTFAAMFYTPRLKASVVLPRLILFKLIFSSGVVKLLSADPTWANLTALDVHYFTQPLPNVVGYLAHFAPGHTAACLLMFFVELLVAPLIFFRPAWSFLPIAGLMFAINGTGNYGFFGPLTIALCCPLLSDATWARLLHRVGIVARPASVAKPRLWTRVHVPAVVALAVVLAMPVVGLLGRGDPTSPFTRLRAAVIDPFDGWGIVSGYGLFAQMTTTRDEITLEGSRDGSTWLPYRFRYKPNDANDAPRSALFHMPRLDWQMWFAALGTCDHNRWFLALEDKLLDHSSTVSGLFAVNPFVDAPPLFLRSRVNRVKFAPLSALAYWEVDAESRPYCPEEARPPAP